MWPGRWPFRPTAVHWQCSRFWKKSPNRDEGIPLALAPESLFIEFEAEQKNGPVWNFSKVKRQQHKLADAATFGNSVAFLPGGKTLAAAGGNTVELISLARRVSVGTLRHCLRKFLLAKRRSNP